MKIKKTSNASYTNIYVNLVYGRSFKSFNGLRSLFNSYEFNPFQEMVFIVIMSILNLYFHIFKRFSIFLT